MNDRDAQMDFVGQDNPLAAVTADDAIAAQVSTLADQPEIGRPGRRAGTRDLVVSRTPFVAVQASHKRAHRGLAPASPLATMATRMTPFNFLSHCSPGLVAASPLWRPPGCEENETQWRKESRF